MLEVVVVIICLVLNALFAALEMAFVTVSKAKLRSLAREGNKEAQRLLIRRENPERTLSILQIGITLVAALAAATGGVVASHNIQPFLVEKLQISQLLAEILSVVFIVLPITYTTIVFGELLPKSIAIKFSLPILLRGSRWLAFADRVFTPAVSTLEWSTKIASQLIFKVVGRPQSRKADLFVDIEPLSPPHRQFVINMADIERKNVGDVFVPWKQVVTVESKAKMNEVLALILSSGHTRLPVVDHKRVLGILHTKEFLTYKESGESNWNLIVRPAMTVKESGSALGALGQMQSKRTHMAVVVDQQNESKGVITIEDIIEEIFGEIYDEDDDGRIRKLYASRVKSRLVPK